MAITYRGSVIAEIDPLTTVNNVPLAWPAGHASDDFAVVFGAQDDNSGALETSATGWTLEEVGDTVSGRDRNWGVWSKRATGGAEADFTLENTTGGSFPAVTAMIVLTGVDTTTAFDVAVPTPSIRNNDVNAANSSVTTVTDNAAILLWQHSTHDGITAVGPAPTGYTMAESSIVEEHAHGLLAYKLDAGTAGTETPGAWNNTFGGNSNADATQFTLAMRPAPGGGGGTTQSVAANLQGTSDTAGVGSRTAELSSQLTGSSASQGVGSRSAALASAVFGSSDTQGTGSRSAAVAATLNGTSDTQGTGSRSAAVAATLNGTSDTQGVGTAAGAPKALASVLVGSPSATGTGHRTAAVSSLVAGAGSVVGVGTRSAASSATLSGASSTSGTGTRTAAVGAVLTGQSGMTGAGGAGANLSAQLDGTSDTAGTGRRIAALSTSLDGTSDVQGVGAVAGVTALSALVTGASTVLANGSRSAFLSSTMAGTSDFQAAGLASEPIAVASNLTGSSNTSATGNRFAALSTSLTGSSSLGAGVQTQQLRVTLSCRSILVEGRSPMAYKKERSTGSAAVAPLFPNGGVGLDAYAEYLREIKQLGGAFSTIGMTHGGADRLPQPSRDPARSCGPVFACMTTRMHVFSEITFAFQERGEDGDEGKLYRDNRLKLLERPWQGATTGDLLAMMEMDATTSGNSFWVIDDEGSGLTRLDPQFTSIVIEPVYAFQGSGVVGHRKLAYVVEYPESDPVVYLADEVAHYMPIPDPAAPWRGMSWINPLLGSEGDVDSYIQSHKKASLQNRAAPALAVVFPPLATREVVDAYREEFERIHGDGPTNRGKTIFTGGGADIKTVGMTWDDLDLRAVQGHGETRIAACAGVPPIIVGLSEGLLAATYSNYGQARRRFADGTLRHLWRNAAGALQQIMPPPRQKDRLWYSDRYVDFVQEDVKDEADIRKSHAQTMRQLIDIGFEPDVVVSAVESGDLSELIGNHTGLFSVQLQPPMTSEQIDEAVDDDDADAESEEEEEVNA